MDSTNIRTVASWAKEYDSQLRADDPRFQRAVLILTDEGTMLVFQNAFALRRHNDPYIYTFTEHHGFHVYYEDDVKVIEYSQRRYELDMI